MLLLDASALLAVLQGERGAEMVTMAMDDGSMSAANLSEVAAKLVQHGDRLCLATAILEKSEVLTADNAWAAIKVDGLNVRYIR